jgi:hypothetical protein
MDTSKLFCQMMLGGQPFSIALPFDNCVVPTGVNGPVAIFITSDGQPLINNVRDRATTQLVAGPAMAFIDTQPQMLGQLSRGASATNPAVSTSTTTISPAQASAVIAAAGSSSAPAAAGSSGAAAASTGSTPSSGMSSALTSMSGPNPFMGQSADGSMTVDGWSNIPNSNSSTSTTPPAASDSSTGGY